MILGTKDDVILILSAASGVRLKEAVRRYLWLQCLLHAVACSCFLPLRLNWGTVPPPPPRHLLRQPLCHAPHSFKARLHRHSIPVQWNVRRTITPATRLIGAECADVTSCVHSLATAVPIPNSLTIPLARSLPACQRLFNGVTQLTG